MAFIYYSKLPSIKKGCALIQNLGSLLDGLRRQYIIFWNIWSEFTYNEKYPHVRISNIPLYRDQKKPENCV